MRCQRLGQCPSGQIVLVSRGSRVDQHEAIINVLFYRFLSN